MTAPELFGDIRRYVAFDDGDAVLLAAARPHVEGDFPSIVDAFYEAIEQQPRARAVFHDAAQIARQKVLLARWMVELLGGVYDEAYFAARARIGLVHVRIGLDPAFMVTAMNVVRSALHEAVERRLDGEHWPTARRWDLHRAIDRICDVDLAIMVETYRDDFAVRIRASERLAALGEIAGTIGHEIRNPLAVMETSLHLLRARLPEDPKAARHVDRLVEQVSLCSSIVRQLMDLARDKPPNRSDVEVARCVTEAVRDLPNGGGVVLEFTHAPSDTCKVDAIQLRQLVSNLVLNALEVASSAGAVVVHVDCEGEELVVRVTDDGPGISPEVRARLFEPLFTTRTNGVGLGLALCRRIAERHGGSIRALETDRGACFEARLPCTEALS